MTTTAWAVSSFARIEGLTVLLAPLPALALFPLLITAGILALVLLWSGVRSGPSAPQLGLEALRATGGLAAHLWGLMAFAQHIPW